MSAESPDTDFAQQARTLVEDMWQATVLPRLQNQMLPNSAKVIAELAGGGWRLRISPPFPDEWARKTSVVYYAYGAYRNPRVMADGEYTSAIWSAVAFHPNQEVAPDVRLIEPVPVTLELQGMEPVAPWERDKLKLDVLPLLFSLLQTAPEARAASTSPQWGPLRDYYCQWFDLNEVAAKHIARHQEAFFNWLACGKK